MKTLLCASVLVCLAAAGCRSGDPDRDGGTSNIGEYVMVTRVPREAGPSALGDLRGTVRQGADEGCVWEAFLTNKNKARAVRATVIKAGPGGRNPQRYAVDVPAGGAVSLGCAHPTGNAADTFFEVTAAGYAD